MTILVLNADMQPLNITSFKRGFNLVWKGKAEVVEYDATAPIESTFGASYKRPLIIRLLRYVYLPYKKVPLTRYNVFRRDGHTCAYCGKKGGDLTLDHIFPKSRGGENSWNNLITSCKKCNNLKDDRTPKEANMKLLFKPYKPTFQQFVIGIKGADAAKFLEYLS